MPLSWNEIRIRAARFAEEWKDASYEKGQTQTFYNEFFEVFGRRPRDVAVYERRVKKLNDKCGFIDLFWPGHLLVEQKSVGHSLEKAREQATDYFLSLKDQEKPRYILLSDFQSFELLDLDTGEEHCCRLSELPEQVRLFGFIAGYQKQTYKDQDPANVEAAQLMGKLHNQLRDSGYVGTDLERLLVRIMFCLFADDTGIFEPDSFLLYIEERTNEDGSDLGPRLTHLFEVLNTDETKRQTILDEHLDGFPYVNGQLFADLIRTPSFNSGMRESLLDCCHYDWTKVSPALFGSLFQSVMLPEEQRQGGAHYTSERNILKTIKPLFLDELWGEFTRIRESHSTHRRAKLQHFQQKLGSLKFLDPACGCGNFLILAYRELRILEIEVLKTIYPGYGRQRVTDISQLSFLDVDQFYGIEIKEFPVRIAEAALWLVDHQMNMRLSEAFGEHFARLPLNKSAHIHHANSLTLDWKDIVLPEELSYILGNPPFIGSKYQKPEQRDEIKALFADVKSAGVLDYVTGWYWKAAQYIQNTEVKVAFVSTNSITQGEQVGILWPPMSSLYGIKIHFAHRTFKWTIGEQQAEGMGVAAVYVVIIGFAAFNTDDKVIFDYETPTSDPNAIEVNNINLYLRDAPDNISIMRRSKPLCNVPTMGAGNKPIDGGYYLFSTQEKLEFLAIEPEAEGYFRRWLGSKEFINGLERWCLYLGDCSPDQLRRMPECIKCLEAVKNFRLGKIPNKKGMPTKKEPPQSTRKLAEFPTQFHIENMPQSTYLVIPKVSSENRSYVPIAFLPPLTLSSDLLNLIPNATLYHFGILTSQMHMVWMRNVCGRLKGDYRYSIGIVYNNFPWPVPTEKQRKKVEEKAQALLGVREQFPNSMLADLYDKLTMPPALLQAHKTLDRVVDTAYRKRPFKGEDERLEFLFSEYQRLTSPLVNAGQPKKTRKKKTS